MVLDPYEKFKSDEIDLWESFEDFRKKQFIPFSLENLFFIIYSEEIEVTELKISPKFFHPVTFNPKRSQSIDIFKKVILWDKKIFPGWKKDQSFDKCNVSRILPKVI